MNIWVIQDGEPLPGIDGDTREWRTAMLSKALVARGHQVTWWASTFDHARKRHRFAGPHIVDLQQGLRVRLLHGPGYRHNKSPRRLWHNRVLARAFGRESVTCPKPDLIFSSLPTLELAEQAVGYGQKARIPVLIDTRDEWPDLYLAAFPQRLRGLARLALIPEFRRAKRVFSAATGITAVSNTYLDWALNYAGRGRGSTDGMFPLGYHHLPPINPADLQSSKKKYGIRSDALILTFVGIFGSSYDLETVIDSARVLHAEGDSAIRIVMVGDGDQGSRLREMAQGLSNVIFTGWVGQSDMAPLLRMSSVGLAAYTGEALQSLPNKPFEFMAAGLPILSSLSGELEVLIRDERIGLHYRAGDKASLISKIRWLAANPDARREMGVRAHKLFEERFSSEIVYPRLIDHLEKTVKNYTLL